MAIKIGDKNFVSKYILQLCATYQYASSRNLKDPLLEKLDHFYTTPEVMERIIAKCYTDKPSRIHLNVNFALAVYDSILQQAVCGKLDALLNRKAYISSVANQLAIQKAILAFYNSNNLIFELFCKILGIHKDKYQATSLISISAYPILAYNEALDVTFVPLADIYRPEKLLLLMLHEVGHYIFSFCKSDLKKAGIDISKELNNAKLRFAIKNDDMFLLSKNIFAELFADLMASFYLKWTQADSMLLEYEKYLLQEEQHIRAPRIDIASKILYYHRLSTLDAGAKYAKRMSELYTEIIEDPVAEQILIATTNMRDAIKKFIASKSFKSGTFQQSEKDVKLMIEKCAEIFKIKKDKKRDKFEKRIELYRWISEYPTIHP